MFTFLVSILFFVNCLMSEGLIFVFCNFSKILKSYYNGFLFTCINIFAKIDSSRISVSFQLSFYIPILAIIFIF